MPYENDQRFAGELVAQIDPQVRAVIAVPDSPVIDLAELAVATAVPIALFGGLGALSSDSPSARLRNAARVGLPAGALLGGANALIQLLNHNRDQREY